MRLHFLCRSRSSAVSARANLLLLLLLQARSTTVWCCVLRSLSATPPSSPHSARQTAGEAGSAARLPVWTQPAAALAISVSDNRTQSSLSAMQAAGSPRPSSCDRVCKRSCSILVTAGRLSRSCTPGLMAPCMRVGSPRQCLCPVRDLPA